jgi:hypothetical protein
MEYQFILQIVTDGSVNYTKRYDSALDAVRAYEACTDYGFARYEREIVLVEPNGAVRSKIFQTPYGVASTVK